MSCGQNHATASGASSGLVQAESRAAAAHGPTLLESAKREYELLSGVGVEVYACLDCGYTWQPRTRFGVDARCPRCNHGQHATTTGLAGEQPEEPDLHSLRTLMRYLAGNDADRAQERNSVGFNKPDGAYGHYVADLPAEEWTSAMTYNAWVMSRRYRRQLEGAGFDVDAIECPPLPDPRAAESRRVPRPEPTAAGGSSEAARPTPTRRIYIDDDGLHIASEYNPAIVTAIKSRLTARRWDGPSRSWVVPTDSILANRGAIKAIVGEWDFELPADVEAEMDAARPPQRLIGVRDGMLWFTFPYDAGVVEAMRTLDNASAKKEDGKWTGWTVPINPENASRLMDIVSAHGFDVMPDAFDAVTEGLRRNETNLELSTKADGIGLTIEGLRGSLRPFQEAGIQYGIDQPRFINGDEPGLGKTIQALGVVQATHSYPVVVVCPASLKLNWRREAAKWLPAGTRIAVVGGAKPLKPEAYDADVVIINYDILGKHLEALRRLGPTMVVADEAHMMANPKAQRTKNFRALIAGASRVGLFTGTPMDGSPKDAVTLIEMVGAMEDTFGGSWKYLNRYTNVHQDAYGTKFLGARNTEELGVRLRARCMVRRRKADVLKDLPPKQWEDVAVDITNRRAYTAAANDVVAFMRQQALEDKSFYASIGGLSPEDRNAAIRMRAESAAQRASQAETLVRLNALRRLAALGKLEAATEWVSNFLVSGKKLVVVGWHKDVVEQIAAQYNAPTITGDTPLDRRQAAVDAFQEDPDCKVICLNIKAGGVGLTLTAASDVLFVEQPWKPKDLIQASDRVHRIGQTAETVTAWRMLAADTIDEDIAALLADRARINDAILDNAVSDAALSDAAAQRSVLGALIAKMRSQGAPEGGDGEDANEADIDGE